MKTESKLVLGLSILSAATLASATTATFAWWGVSSTAVAGSNTTYETMTVSKAEFSAGELTIPVTVSLQKVSGVDDNLVLARHSTTDTTDPDLESAYLNSTGAVVPVPAASVAAKFGTGKILYSTLKLTISIDYSDTGWKQEGGSQATSYANAATYTDAHDVTYTAGDIYNQLNGQTIKVGMKHTESSSERGRLFRTTSGANDPFYYNGTTSVSAVDSEGDDFDGYTIIDAALDNNFVEGKIEIASYISYYVYGGNLTDADNDAGTPDVETEDGDTVVVSFDVKVAGNATA